MSSSTSKRKRDESANAVAPQNALLAKAVGELKSFVVKNNSAPPLPAVAVQQPPHKKPAKIATPIGNKIAPPPNAAAVKPAWPKTVQPKAPKNTKPAPFKPNDPPKQNESPGASFIDEIINEANDLLQAASEAQCLGRLRAASSYLLLAHARLVGLGRRFDRSRCLEDEQSTPSSINDENSTTISQNNSIILPPLPVAHNALPDVSLMEHLARSGMELHHKRTGRGMQHDAQMEKIGSKTSGSNSAVGVKKEEDTPTKRKGGRGKKPPTLVMHTLLGAELDAKRLMAD